MRLLAVCKRRPQNRDLFTRPYGRFYHLSRLLAERGHEVHLLLADYAIEAPVSRSEGNLHLHAVSILPWPCHFFSKAHDLMVDVGPDWVIGFSDTWFGIQARRLAARYGGHSLIDAYDNYESYIPWARPLHRAWRRALFSADAVTAAGPQLAELMRETSGRASIEIVPMAADPSFVPLPQADCRRRFGLPLDRMLVGYAGSIHPNRGIDLLFSVYAKLREIDPRIGLVLSGRLFSGVRLPPDVYWLGYQSDDEVPCILNSLDLLFVVNKPSTFGKYSYPAKLYEALACGVPVLASNVPGTSWILRDSPELLARTNDIDDFATKGMAILRRGRACRPPASDGWAISADVLEKVLLRF